MTVFEALKWGKQELQRTYSQDPASAAAFLLRHVIRQDPMKLLIYEGDQETLLTPDQASLFRDMVNRRTLHEPVWYITEEAFFWKFPFMVDNRVLIPRPETERLVEAVLEYAKKNPKQYTVIDVGTGSGAIAISLYKEMKSLGLVEKFYASDVSVEAIEVAQLNARNLKARGIEFLIGDGLEPLKEPVGGLHVCYDLIVGNPPYIPTETVGGLAYEIHHFEPRVAIDGGPDGLDVHRKILRDAKKFLKKGGAIFLEIGHDQGQAIKRMAREHFPRATINILKDYDTHDRVLSLQT